MSLSARRAWIEMHVRGYSQRTNWVALRKESVDRNRATSFAVSVAEKSLSARRAWIEIIDYIIDYVNDAVALRKESVDRNSCHLIPNSGTFRRSPQGERG